MPTSATPNFATEYQAVFMQNGQVFFGKLKQVGTTFPILSDVFYIRNQIDPETKASNSILLKRSSELHGPEVMYINAQQIALIESVSPTSRVGQLLDQAQGSVLPAPSMEPKPQLARSINNLMEWRFFLRVRHLQNELTK